MQTYDFPTRQLPELVSAFQVDFPQLDISERDFKQPKRERWVLIFSTLVSDLAGFNLDNLRNIHVTNAVMEYHALHNDSIPLWNLFALMKHLLPKMGFVSFGLNDIIRPEPKRLLRICSAYFNFYQFKQTRLLVYDRIKQDELDEADVRHKHEKENDELQEQINAIHMRRAAEEPTVTRLQGGIDEIQGHIKTLEHTASAAQKTLNEKKAAASDVQIKVARVKETIAAAQQEKSRLSGQIVQSPARVKADKDRMLKQVVNHHQDKEERLRRMVELRSNVKRLQELDECCDVALRLINDIKNLIDNEKAQSKALREIEEKSQSAREVIHATETKEQQLNRFLNVKIEALDKVLRQHKMRNDEMAAALTSLKSEREQLLQAQHHDSKEKEATLDDLQQLQEAEAALIQSHDAKLLQLQNGYNDTLKSLDLYHINLGNSWDKLSRNMDAFISSAKDDV